MIQQFNPDMLTIARDIRGFTQVQLSDITGLDQGYISRLETGTSDPKTADLEKLSKALEYPVEYFFRRGDRFGVSSGGYYHRKRSGISAGEAKSLEGWINGLRLDIERLIEAVDLDPAHKLPQIRPEETNYDIEEIAARTRSALKIPSGPIRNLVKRLEGAGIIVYYADLKTERVDAQSQWVPRVPPVIMINDKFPGERIRFTAAHELGHLVMHEGSAVAPKIEDEANSFASAFLMPAEDIAAQLRPVTLEHMAQLKLIWKVSIQALVVRAHDLEIITTNQYRSLYTQINKLNYRKNEPFPLAPEEPKLVNQLISFYLKELGYSTQELAKLLSLREKDLRNWYFPAPPPLEIVKPKLRRLMGE